MSSNDLPAWGGFVTNTGRSLDDLSDETFVLLVFLRHGGCPFCLETLAALRRERSAIEADGMRIVLVHLMSDGEAAKLFQEYGLADLDRVSDPDAKLFAACGLTRGNLWAIAGPAVWWRGFRTTILQGFLPRLPKGDVFQLPGLCLVHRRQIVRRHISRTSADMPALAAFACPLPKTSESH